ncbi:MAG: hypothetical protein RLY82_1686 [Pseudomonadota bacterium]
MNTLLQLIKMFKFKNLLLCGVLLSAGSVMAQPTMKTLVAGGDTLNVTNPIGGTATVLSNDTADGLTITAADLLPAPDSLALALTNDAGLTANVTIDGTNGNLTVTGSPAAGSYTLNYQVCQPIFLGNCATGTVSLTVTAAAATLVATADTGLTMVAGTAGAFNILANDTSNGAAATTTNVTPSIVTAVTGFSINGSGQLAATTAVTAGSYPVTYKICEVGNLTNCSANATATVTVTAAAVVGGAGLVLAVDAITMPVTGGSLNVLNNDRFNTASISNSSVTLTLTDSAGATGATLSPTGDLFIPTGLAQRVYLMTYKVCLVSVPTTCATSTASISVSAAVTTATVKAPSVPGATASNSNVITTATASTGGTPLSFSTGSSSGGSTTAGSGSISDPLTFTGARVSFGESITGFATVRLYASQDIPKFVAQLNFNGAGTLNANWVVIRPGDAEPTEVDLLPEGSLSVLQKSQRNRNYQFIERASGYASGGSYLLVGPDPSKLPKSIPGIYRILLRLEGFGSFAMPALRYIVQSGTPPAPRMTSLATPAVATTTPQVTAASINTTAPTAGMQFVANGVGAVVNLAWNWGASQSATPVASWHYEIYFDNERIVRMGAGVLKPDIRNFRLMLPSNFFAGKNLRWVVYGRDKDRQVVARSADMFFSMVAANP